MNKTVVDRISALSEERGELASLAIALRPKNNPPKDGPTRSLSDFDNDPPWPGEWDNKSR